MKDDADIRLHSSLEGRPDWMTFPAGKTVTVGRQIDSGRIVLGFAAPVSWVDLSPDVAREIGQTLIRYAGLPQGWM